MFYMYWILMIALISSFAYMTYAKNEKNYGMMLSSFLQCGCTVILTLFHFGFISNHQFISFEVYIRILIQECCQGSLLAILSIAGYLLMFGLVLFNGFWMTDRKLRYTIKV